MTFPEPTDHVYAARVGGDLLVSEYLPPVGEPSAVYLFFHGGGWTTGSRLAPVNPARFGGLVEQGIVVLSADYRLTPGSIWPSQLEDAGDAVQWAAERWPGKPLFLAGGSAGGQLAALVGLGAWTKLTGRELAVRPSGVITYALVADPLQWDRERLHLPLPEPGTFAYRVYERDGHWPPALRAKPLLDGADTTVSPTVANHIDRGAVPFLIIHGNRDTCVAVDESRQLFETLTRKGDQAFLLEIAGADHDDDFGAPTLAGAIGGFIRQHAGPR